MENEAIPNLSLAPFEAAGIRNPPKLDATERYIPDVEVLSHEALLNSDYIPSTVFYIWCGRRSMEFHNYLSIKSVIQELKPDNLVFYYDELPVTDKEKYNTWFRELQLEYPFFRLCQIRQNEPWGNPCEGPSKPNMDFIYKRLWERGGMYVHELTVITKLPLWYRNQSLVHALDPDSFHGFIMAKPKVPVLQILMNASDKYPTKKLLCAPDNSTYDRSPKKPACVHAKDVFYPENIWELDTDFGALCRRIFYKTTKILRPEPSYDELIPNIAHLVWLGGEKIDFLFYMSVLSLIYVAKVDQVYLHGNGPPTGQYWSQIKNHPKLHLIYREAPKKIFGTDIQVIEHVTDVWRVDIMIRYGGIYIDTDAVFVKPLTREIRAYDAVGSVDWPHWNPPFPDIINYGVAIGKRNATYWHEFQKSMHWWLDNDWNWNGLRQPYKIKERRPDLVRLDPRLQVICFEYKCHPTWWPNYYNESIHHLNSPSITDWCEDTFTFHWTYPTPPELKSEEEALASDSMFGEIAQYILHMAGVHKRRNRNFRYTNFTPDEE